MQKDLSLSLCSSDDSHDSWSPSFVNKGAPIGQTPPSQKPARARSDARVKRLPYRFNDESKSDDEENTTGSGAEGRKDAAEEYQADGCESGGGEASRVRDDARADATFVGVLIMRTAIAKERATCIDQLP